jgi:hypothetical protein
MQELLTTTAIFAVAFWRVHRALARIVPAGPGAALRQAQYIECVYAAVLVTIGWTWKGTIFPLHPAWILFARAVPLGYLVHDLYLVYSTPGLRHVLSIIHRVLFSALAVSAIPEYPEQASRAYLTEITIPILVVHQIALESGMREIKPRLFTLYHIATLASFAWLRMRVLVALLDEAIILRAGPHIVFLLMGIAIINVFWVYLIVTLDHAVGLRA